MGPMSRFLFADDLAPGEEAELSAEESHHLTTVLRMREGDEIRLVNGRGRLTKAVVAKISKRKATVRAESFENVEPSSRVTLAFGIAKSAALEFILKRATEVGVAAFQPLQTHNSLRLREWNSGRWERMIAEAAKQCEELHFPRLLPPLPLEKWLSMRDHGSGLAFCDEDRRSARTTPARDKNWDVLVGAEGGWNDEERDEILASGATVFGLGRNRLRAETAALAALILLKHEIGEF